MPDPTDPPPPKKNEGWLGVAFTAALCGLFLWWWFLPEPVSAATERDPLYWVGRARQDLGKTEPSLPLRLEIVMIAEALRERGDTRPADSLEADWLPASWRVVPATDPASPPAHDTATPSAPPPSVPSRPAALAPIVDRLDQAAAAFDTLEIEDAQHQLREAAQAAAALPDPPRTDALWLVAARQARNGLESDARATGALSPAAAAPHSFPDWLVTEMFDSDIIAPVVASLHARPPDDPSVIALARRWRALVRQRLADRDHPLLTRFGPAADTTQPSEPEPHALWTHVEANRLTAAAAVAQNDPSAHLAIARLLVWLAAPLPAETP